MLKGSLQTTNLYGCIERLGNTNHHWSKEDPKDIIQKKSALQLINSEEDSRMADERSNCKDSSAIPNLLDKHGTKSIITPLCPTTIPSPQKKIVLLIKHRQIGPLFDMHCLKYFSKY